MASYFVFGEFVANMMHFFDPKEISDANRVNKSDRLFGFKLILVDFFDAVNAVKIANCWLFGVFEIFIHEARKRTLKSLFGTFYFRSALF